MVGRLVDHLGHGAELVLCVHGDLSVVTHAHFAHPPAVGVGERDLRRAAFLHGRERLLVTLLALAQRGDLLRHAAAHRRGGPGGRRRLGLIAHLQRGEELREPCVDALAATRAAFRR